MAAVMNEFESDIDLFTDEALLNPFPLYRKLRDLAPAAYLTKYQMWFLGRYDQLRAALGDWKTFSSAQGVLLNPVLNEAWRGALICVDPPVHTEQRKLYMSRLSPMALKPIGETVQRRADELAQQLVKKGQFDGVTELAHDLPVNIIMDLIGWPNEVRPKLLSLATGSFDACGPIGPRMEHGLGRNKAMMDLVAETYDNKAFTPGGFASTIAEAGHRGEITREEAIALLVGYVVAAFDTTINAMASGVWLFAENPDQWDRLRADPSLITRAFNEIVRMESPLQNFSRVTTRDVELDEGITIPKGDRVIVSYAAANRDERHFPNPDKFDIGRANADHLAFSGGNHGCAGQSLARMEGHAVFLALAKYAKGFRLAGTPKREINNITRGFLHLPLEIF